VEFLPGKKGRTVIREMVEQAGLGSFGIGAGDAPTDTLRPPESAIELVGTARDSQFGILDRDRLPDLEGFDWHATTTSFGPVGAVEYWRLKSKPSWDTDHDHEDIPGEGYAVITGADEYLREHALATLDFPDYYTNFTDVENQYRWSVDGATHVTPRVLRTCVRLANGTGRIDTAQTELVLCAPGTIMVAGLRGLFLVPLADSRHARQVDPLPDPPSEVFHTVSGLDVPEEDPELRYGLWRYLDLVDEAFPVGVAYEQLADGHVLSVDPGDSVTLSHSQLLILANHDQDLQQVCRETTYSVRGDEYRTTVSEDTLPGPIGTHATLAPADDGGVAAAGPAEGVVAGYRVRWRDGEYLSPSSTGIAKVHCEVCVALVQPDLSVTLETIPIETIDNTENA
jgi:hypothetical protein